VSGNGFILDDRMRITTCGAVSFFPTAKKFSAELTFAILVRRY
jgi:hypothetical protein